MNLRLLFVLAMLSVALLACGPTPSPDNPYWQFEVPGNAKLLGQESTPDSMAFRSAYELPDKQPMVVKVTLMEHSPGFVGEKGIADFDTKFEPLNVLGVECEAKGKLRYVETGPMLHMVNVELCMRNLEAEKHWYYDEDVINAILESYEPKESPE